MKHCDLCVPSHQFYEEIAEFLQENNDTGRGVVVAGVGPQQADDVHHGWQELLHAIKVGLLQILKVVTQWLQMDVDVRGLVQGCNHQTNHFEIDFSVDWLSESMNLTAKFQQ